MARGPALGRCAGARAGAGRAASGVTRGAVLGVQELAVMVARGRSGEVAACPVAETLHVNSILLAAEAPARVPARLRDRARAVAERAVACLDGALPWRL